MKFLQSVMKTIISNVCRAVLSTEILDLAKPGIVEIPETLLAPRQIKIVNTDDKFLLESGVSLKAHRGSMIPTMSPTVAAQLVEQGAGVYEPQGLLSYTREDYLSDPDVKADEKEFERVSSSDAELVVVAVTGNNRSPLAVVRNIVSGCQKMERLEKDAKDAMEASCIILIE